MNKEKFLFQLERLLYDIPKEEREEALEYYRSYFEEAGEDMEDAVLEELGSAQEIASSIKEGLSGGASREEYLKYPPQVREKKGQSQSGPQKDAYDYGKTAGNYRRYYEKEADAGASSGREYRQYGDYKRYSDGLNKDRYKDRDKNREIYKDKDKTTKWIILILAVVLTSPLWGSLLSALIGIAGMCIAVFVGLLFFSVGGLIGGIVCVVVGITRLCVAAFVQGSILLGVGLLLIAASAVSVVLLVLLCGRFAPWALRQVTDLSHRLMDWFRRSLA